MLLLRPRPSARTGLRRRDRALPEARGDRSNEAPPIDGRHRRRRHVHRHHRAPLTTGEIRDGKVLSTPAAGKRGSQAGVAAIDVVADEVAEIVHGHMVGINAPLSSGRRSGPRYSRPAGIATCSTSGGCTG
ncbi:hypothetical protein HBB16_16415 [Pseudonocardia sp. MCCB 268]|nr:hypothetical protein [Pseudonocardia cytotoxica]